MLNGYSDFKHKSHMVFHLPQFFSVFYAETDICNCAFSYLVHTCLYVWKCTVEWGGGHENEQCVSLRWEREYRSFFPFASRLPNLSSNTFANIPTDTDVIIECICTRTTKMNCLKILIKSGKSAFRNGSLKSSTRKPLNENKPAREYLNI